MRHQRPDLEAEWMERYGLTRSGGHVCVRRLALGRCGLTLASLREPGVDWDECQRRGGRVLDHASMYLRGGQAACIVGHEYGASDGVLGKLNGWRDRWPQLGAELSAESWYFPGRTFMVALFNREVWAPPGPPMPVASAPVAS